MTEAKGVALVFAAALAATLIMAGPVVRAPTERLFGSGAVLSREDPNRDALVVIEQLRTGAVPSPYLQPLTDLPGRALSALVGPVAAYNILVLGTFPLSAAAAYSLARYVLGSAPGAIVAGFAYAFLPFHVTQASGHPHATQTQWLPLYLLALWRCVDRPDVARAGWLLAAGAAAALSDFYGGLIVAVMSPVALVAYGVVSPRDATGSRARRLAFTGLVLAGAAAAGLVVIHLFAPDVLLRPDRFAFARSDLFTWSAKWWSYLVPPVEHPWLGPAARHFWRAQGVEESLLEHQQVALAWSLLVLGAVPTWLWLRGHRSALAVRSAPVLLVLAFAGLLCSLSPERRLAEFTFVRPSALLYEVAPMFRAYARFAVVVGLAASLLAGAGAACLWQSPRRRLAAATLLGLACLEYAPFPPWRWRHVLPTRAHRWLAEQAGPFRVLDCVPPTRMSDSLAATVLGHEVSLLGSPPFDDCGEPHLGQKLAAAGFTHVVARRDSRDGPWLLAHPPAGVAAGPAFSESSVLAVTARPPDLYVSGWLGFHPREYDGEDTWRWMSQTGALRLVAVRETTGAVLELALRAFPRERRVEWFLDGRKRGEVEVAPEWRRYALPLGPLAAGEATLTLASREPAVSAQDVLLNGDPRTLGLAVGEWRIAEVGR